MKNFKFLISALKIQAKLDLAYKSAFITKLIAMIAKQGLYIVTWMFFFTKYVSIANWGFREALAMYGIISFGTGFVELFFYGLRELPLIILTNQLDNYLTQPKNVILNVALSRGNVSAFSEVIYGILLLFISNYLFSEFALVLLVLPLSVIFVFSLYIYLSSVGFFIKNSYGFVRELYQSTSIIISQPSSAYKGVFKLFTLTIFPIAYLNFFPVEFLRTLKFRNIAYAYAGAISFFIIACIIFYRGLKRYESSSIISQKY